MFKIINDSLHNLISYLKYSLFVENISANSIRRRLILLIIAFLFIFGVIYLKLVIVSSESFLEMHSAKIFKGFRRDIVDRNGNLLATNLDIASLFAHPNKVLDIADAVQKIRHIFPNMSENELILKLNSNKKFVWIKKDITPKQQEQIKNAGIPGFDFEREQKRIYTHANMFSHVLGYVGRDMNGMSGIEKYFDEEIKIHNNRLLNNKKQNVVELSLDLQIQSIVEEELSNTIKKFSAKGGGAIVVNPNNGEIIALVSKPDFNPHKQHNPSDKTLFNTITQGVYEIGSGMKTLVMAIGLDSNSTKLTDAYDISYMKISGFELRDYHSVKGWSSVPKIFMKSSNIGMSQIMLLIGKVKLREYLKKMGMLDKISIELPERTSSLFLPYAQWTDLTLATMSYGYSMSVTPIHFMQAMVPVVNGGIKYPLTLLKNKVDYQEKNKVLKITTSRDMRKLLHLVAREGTARKSAILGCNIGGKTGTAHKIENKKYVNNKRISSFFGIMPAYKAEYLIYVMIDEPQGIKETYGFATGGWVAAPLGKRILEKIAVLYNVCKPHLFTKEINDLNDIEYEMSDEI